MFAFSLLVAAQAAAGTPVTIPAQPELTRQIAAADADLFKLFFEGPCDAARLRSFLADDVEFYHDKGGVTARNADQFVADYRQNCKAREDPKAWRSRRELVAGSLHVDPVPGWGAIEAGDHLFYERQGVDGTEKLAGRAKFAMLWVLGSDGKWRLSRVLSFAHAPAQ